MDTISRAADILVRYAEGYYQWLQDHLDSAYPRDQRALRKEFEQAQTQEELEAFAERHGEEELARQLQLARRRGA